MTAGVSELDRKEAEAVDEEGVILYVNAVMLRASPNL